LQSSTSFASWCSICLNASSFIHIQFAYQIERSAWVFGFESFITSTKMTSNSLSDWVNPHLNLTLGMKFYDVPENAPATFSTKNGSIKKRQLPVPPSPPVARSDVDIEIRRKAKLLREEFPAIVRGISHPPTTWFDLYKYFDGVDLWYEDASFLFYVLNHISNENVVLNHNLEESKHAEIRNWAKLWVDASVQRILNVPGTQDLISIFDESEKESIDGLDNNQIALLRNALNLFRKEYDHLLPPVDELRLQVPPQSTQPMRLPVQPQPYHPALHHRLQQGQSIIRQGPPMIQHGRSYPMTVGEPHHNQMVPGKLRQYLFYDATANEILAQPMSSMQSQHPPSQRPLPLPYNTFMEQQRSIAPFNPMPQQGPGDFHQDMNPQWDRRQRGYSNETSRGGRGGRGNGHLNNFGPQNRNFQPIERRMVADNTIPRGSPLGRVSHLNQVSESLGPVYVHDSQRQSPPFDGDATPRASGRGTQNNNQRIFSDPSSGRSGFSNDARLWQSNDRQRANSKPQEVTNDFLPPPPFEGHPQAVILVRSPPHKSTCTFWCVGQPRNPYDAQGPRTVYVKGFDRDDFESRGLERLFAKFGQVESISYLYASHSNCRGGPAFIA
jgi:hypothetical protein